MQANESPVIDNQGGGISNDAGGMILTNLEVTGNRAGFGTKNLNGGQVIWDGGTVSSSLSDITNGCAVNIELVVTKTAAGTLTNNASVSASTSDPKPNNDNASETTTVDPVQPSGIKLFLPLILRDGIL